MELDGLSPRLEGGEVLSDDVAMLKLPTLRAFGLATVGMTKGGERGLGGDVDKIGEVGVVDVVLVVVVDGVEEDVVEDETGEVELFLDSSAL